MIIERILFVLYIKEKKMVCNIHFMKFICHLYLWGMEQNYIKYHKHNTLNFYLKERTFRQEKPLFRMVFQDG